MVLSYQDANGELQIVPLGTKPTRIGRAADGDIVLDDERVSRRHCEIRFADGRWVLHDLGSQNGTLVGGRAAAVHALRPGDRFRVGGTEFSVGALEGRRGETVVLPPAGSGPARRPRPERQDDL